MKIGDLVIYRSAMDTMPFRGIVVDYLPGVNIRYGFESEYIFLNSELIKIHWLCPPDLGPELAVQKLIRLNQEILSKIPSIFRCELHPLFYNYMLIYFFI